uniref:Uncharacterized protein n=2 Tax=Acrobeloides nanus TaxID=290746 RepID=A0A914CFN3_9BILA
MIPRSWKTMIGIKSYTQNKEEINPVPTCSNNSVTQWKNRTCTFSSTDPQVCWYNQDLYAPAIFGESKSTIRNCYDYPKLYNISDSKYNSSIYFHQLDGGWDCLTMRMSLLSQDKELFQTCNCICNTNNCNQDNNFPCPKFTPTPFSVEQKHRDAIQQMNKLDIISMHLQKRAFVLANLIKS